MKNSLLIAAVAASTISLTANAALHKRGDNMVYDDVLNITWLIDANYAKTSGYDADGKMTWKESNTWAANLVINDPVYGKIDNWRLPKANLLSTEKSSSLYDGGQNSGYNVVRGELGHMFTNNLKNLAEYDKNGNRQQNYGALNSIYSDGVNSVAIKNLQNYAYWYSDAYKPNNCRYVGRTCAYVFNNENGMQYAQFTHLSGNVLMAWAVRDGDVAPVNEVPLPAAAWLFGAALAGLAGVRRRK